MKNTFWGALASCLLWSSAVDADVAPPRRLMLAVGEVQIIEPATDAPPNERQRAIRDARASMEGFLTRIDRCLSDRGGLPDDRVRIRLDYDRGTLPVRSSVVLGRAGLSACVAEVLPSIALTEAPHGRLRLEMTVVATASW